MVEGDTPMESSEQYKDVADDIVNPTKDTGNGQTDEESQSEISVQFVSESGEEPFPPFEVPKDITPAKLLLVLRAFLTDDESKTRPYLFFVNNQEVSVSLSETLRYQLVDLLFMSPHQCAPLETFATHFAGVLLWRLMLVFLMIVHCLLIQKLLATKRARKNGLLQVCKLVRFESLWLCKGLITMFAVEWFGNLDVFFSQVDL